MSLLDKKCKPCEGGVDPLTGKKLAEYQAMLLTPWQVILEKKLQKEFVFEDFQASLAFVNNVAAIAEQEGHHPDFYIHYNKVVIELWTHAIDGLSENDFIVAAKIDQL